MYHVLMPVDSSESRGVAQAKTVEALPNASEAVTVTLLYAFDDVARVAMYRSRETPGGRGASDPVQEAG